MVTQRVVVDRENTFNIPESRFRAFCQSFRRMCHLPIVGRGIWTLRYALARRWPLWRPPGRLSGQHRALVLEARDLACKLPTRR